MPSNFRLPGSLKARLTLFMLIVFVASLWSLTWYVSRLLRHDMQQQLGAQQLAAVSFIASAADAHLHERIKALELLATTITPEAMEQADGLQNLLDQQPILQSLFSAGVLITSADGTAIASAPRTLGRTGINFMDRSAVTMALKDHRTTIGAAVMDKRLAVPVIGIAAPIVDATGRSLGTLTGVVALKNADFLDPLTQSPYGKTGRYFLVAKQERLIIAATHKEHTMRPLPAPGTIAAVDRFAGGFEGTQVYLNHAGTEMMGSAKSLQLAGWAVGASVSTAEAFAPVQAMQQRMLMAALLLSVLVGLLTWWMLRRQLWPLLDTANTLARMASTDLPAQPLPVARQDEIGTLVMGFNHMLATLETQKSALQKQLLLFAGFIDALPTPIFIKDTRTIFMACNKAYEEAFGIKREVFIGKTVLELDYLSVAARQAFQAADVQLMEQGGQTNEEIEFTFADGNTRTALYQRRAFDLGAGQGSAMLGLIMDISERKQRDDYKHFYSHILEMLAAGSDLHTVLQAIVQGVEKLHPGKLCSILLLDEEGKYVCRCIAPSLPETYNAALVGLKVGMGVGSCGTAAFTGERVVVETIATHPYWADYKDLAAQAGLGSCWSQPIRSGSHRMLGTFGIYHRGSHQPSEADIALIEQTARLASITIDKALAQERLHESQAFAKAVLNSVSNEIVVIDQHGLIVAANDAWRQFALQHSSTAGQMAPHTQLGAKYLGICSIGHSDPSATDTAHITHVAQGIQAVLDGQQPFFSQEYAFHVPTEKHWFVMAATPLAEGRRGAVIVHTNITQRKRAEEQIHNLAYYDSLTQLPNRRMLDDRLQQALASSQRTGLYGALVLLDLDNFKPLNDTHGHDVGDLLLIEVAQRLLASVREVDTVARLGGDEFVVLLANLDAQWPAAQAQALAVAEKIRLALAQPYLLSPLPHQALADTIEHHCSSSIGVALFAGGDTGSATEILKQADDAMYRAKESGRNVVHFSLPQMPTQSTP